MNNRRVKIDRQAKKSHIRLMLLQESHIDYTKATLQPTHAMKTTLLSQIRRRRTNLSLKIQDMVLRAGLTRQQYGKIENGGNPRLSTLDQIAEGLECTLLLVPKEQLAAVQRLLEGEQAAPDTGITLANEPVNPWDDLP